MPKSDRCAGISVWNLDCGEQGEKYDGMWTCVCSCACMYGVQSLKPTLTNKHMLIMEEITGRSSSTLPLKRSKMHDCRAQPELVMGITPCYNTASLSFHLSLPLSPTLTLCPASLFWFVPFRKSWKSASLTAFSSLSDVQFQTRCTLQKAQKVAL